MTSTRPTTEPDLTGMLAAAQLDLLESQHAQIDPLIGVAADRTLPRQQRAPALAELDALINTHLDDEERVALPLINAHITLLPAPIRVLVRLSWMPACRRRRRRLYGTAGR